VFAYEIARQTTYRSITSLPLRFGGGTEILGALDLYSNDPQTLSPALLDAVRPDIADPIAAVLFGLPIGDDTAGLTPSSWMSTQTVTDRKNVWIAIGMLMERLDLQNADALAVLRGYA